MKPTVGKIATDLLQSEAPRLVNPQEIQRAQEKEYLDNLVWCVSHARKEVDCSTIENHESCKDRTALEGDFFIAALIKKEKLLENVIRNYFVPTKACPTPTYDQTLYRYNSKKGSIEYLWTVPDRETCLTFAENKDKIVPAEQGLLKFVLEFYDGTLYRLCKKFNGEAQYAGGSLIGKEEWQ